jgi:uncharacterized damage-inducible protein DinB
MHPAFERRFAMIKRLSCLTFVALLVPVAAAAQKSNPVSDALRQSLQRQSKNIEAAAEAMPPDKYSFKPTADQITFGHLMMHIAGSNTNLCAAISGEPKPEDAKLSETDPKDKLVDAVKASFDYCTKVLANLDDSKLDGQLTLFGGRSFSRATAMFALSGDWTDHYSAAAMYLRLNGILPPTAQKKPQ